jgi:pre-rRNA-processing protein TSR3
VKTSLPIILHLSQDDPKKCSARKMARFHKARLVEHFHDIPYGYLLLDPFSKIALSPADKEVLDRRGLAAIDCSWEDAERIFKKFKKARKAEYRALPLLLATNPVKFGKWGELSTLEALAASYYIMGFKDDAAEMMSIYTWGEKFIEINREPLEAYSECANSTEVVEVQKEFL